MVLSNIVNWICGISRQFSLVCDYLYLAYFIGPSCLLSCRGFLLSLIFFSLVDQIYMMFALHSWSIWGCVSLPGEWMVGQLVMVGWSVGWVGWSVTVLGLVI